MRTRRSSASLVPGCGFFTNGCAPRARTGDRRHPAAASEHERLGSPTHQFRETEGGSLSAVLGGAFVVSSAIVRSAARPLPTRASPQPSNPNSGGRGPHIAGCRSRARSDEDAERRRPSLARGGPTGLILPGGRLLEEPALGSRGETAKQPRLGSRPASLAIPRFAPERAELAPRPLQTETQTLFVELVAILANVTLPPLESEVQCLAPGIPLVRCRTDPAHRASSIEWPSDSMRPSRRSRPSRIVNGWGGQPGT